MKIVADGREYPFPKDLEMGELRTLKRLFDLPRPAELDLGNIDHIAGLVFIAMRRLNSKLPDEVHVERIDALKRVELVPEEGDEQEEESGPTVAADQPQTTEPPAVEPGP